MNSLEHPKLEPEREKTNRLRRECREIIEEHDGSKVDAFTAAIKRHKLELALLIHVEIGGTLDQAFGGTLEEYESAVMAAEPDANMRKVFLGGFGLRDGTEQRITHGDLTECG